MKEEFKLFPFEPNTKMTLRSSPEILRSENTLKKIGMNKQH